jgi:hypothetical protein
MNLIMSQRINRSADSHVRRPGGWLNTRTKLSALLPLLWLVAFTTAAQSGNGTEFASFQIIGQRNIFDPSRVPHRRSSTSTAHVVDSFSFVGTMSYTKGNFAFFDGTSEDFRKVLELNGSIADFKVTAINPKSVTLSSGTNETVLPLGTQMYRDDDGHCETASYASAGASSGADRHSSNRRRGGGFSTGLTAATDGLQSDNSNTSPTNDASDAGPDLNAPATPPAAAGGNDALTRLMQRRAQEEQQLGQGR